MGNDNVSYCKKVQTQNVTVKALPNKRVNVSALYDNHKDLTKLMSAKLATRCTNMLTLHITIKTNDF